MVRLDLAPELLLFTSSPEPSGNSWPSGSPFLTFTHSRCRGDLSSRASAQSWPITAPAIRAIAKMESSIVSWRRSSDSYWCLNSLSALSIFFTSSSDILGAAFFIIWMNQSISRGSPGYPMFCPLCLELTIRAP